MKQLFAISIALTLCLGIVPLAQADMFWDVYADSTLAGQDGYLLKLTDESGEGFTIFIIEELGHKRLVAERMFGNDDWEIFPEGWYVGPGPDDSIGSHWTTIADDLGRPSSEYFESIEPYSGPLGTLITARCVTRPDEDTDTYSGVRYFGQGIGIVAEYWPEDGTDVLTDFSIVGGSGYFPMAVGNTWTYGWIDDTSPVGDAPLALNLLHACSPNPFNPQTRISFEMAADAHASLQIFDVAGHLVKTLVNEQRSAGMHSVNWNGRDEAGRSAAAGVYLYRFEAGESVQTRRMTLVK